ncbi:winged helix-turn-helix transcriptional regulator [Paenibacillus sp. F411]|uniref:ArsR/SmtB family transcription factor n=1 Tax=Paenibacillus sp. F411 TaxID=2820239 RepID=UPI001AAF0B7A|nr:helix-turn-helix domain-containing protein [Paenibacillus sp. F411]MBO2943005.1 winged helix-turn-helix transcriptional regulator [Paenibacillus sp. F411]
MKYKVSVDVSVVYECLSSFMIYVTKKWTDNLDIGPSFMQDLDQRLPEEVKSKLNEARDWPFLDFDVLYALIMLRDPHMDDQPAAFLDWLDSTPVEELYSRLITYMPVLSQDELQRVIDTYPALIRLWYHHYFQEAEHEYRLLLEEDAQEKSILLSKMEPESLVEYATGGVILDNLPVTSVILFPGVHFRPINTYCFYENLLLIQYPVDVPEDNEDDPPMVLLRMTDALAHPERLRLLRFVAHEPKTVGEIGKHLALSDERLLHHLVILRAAGLLRSHVDTTDENGRFSLRPDGAAELQMFLESYMRLT